MPFQQAGMAPDGGLDLIWSSTVIRRIPGILRIQKRMADVPMEETVDEQTAELARRQAARAALKGKAAAAPEPDPKDPDYNAHHGQSNL